MGSRNSVSTAASRGGISWLSIAVSGAALLASVVSLWESTLKRPDLKVYVTDNIYYTRDPWGSYEVAFLLSRAMGLIAGHGYPV